MNKLLLFNAIKYFAQSSTNTREEQTEEIIVFSNSVAISVATLLTYTFVFCNICYTWPVVLSA